jgi:xylono-1,5-lactonase
MTAIEVGEIRCEQETGCLLGEGGRWLASEQALYFIDIKRPAIFKYRPSDRQLSKWQSPEMISAFAPRVGGGFIAAFASGLYTLSLSASGDTVERRFLIAPKEHHSPDRFNDGVCHPDGSFWAGTMDDAECEKRGWFYRLDASGRFDRLNGPYMVCNGPTFSPDGKIAYLTDSAARTIYRRSTDPAKPEIEIFAQLNEQDGYPDGMTTDREGRLWIACWDGGKVLCIGPDAARVTEIRLPVSRPTSCAFGGEKLDTLFITSASIGLSKEALDGQPLAGGLFSVSLRGAVGLPTACYGS